MALNRRQFLTGSAGFLAGATVARGQKRQRKESKVPPIERIDLFPMRYPMIGYFKFFSGPHGSAGRAAVVVKITAEDGTIGWGQSVPIAKWSYETLETALIVLRRYYAPALIGHDPTRIEDAHATMDEAVASGFTTGMPIARAGIDLALHDLTGKLKGKPVAELWGRSAENSVPLSWTVNVQELEAAPQRLAEGREAGYEHFNIKVGSEIAFDRKLAELVRQEAPDSFLWADANGGYDEPTALAAAPELAEAGVDVLEAPLKPNRLRGYQRLKKQGALPILMDEGLISPTEVEEFAALQMLDGVAMKPPRCAGLLFARRQIEIVQKQNLMWLGSGLTDPDISFSAALHLYSAYGIDRPAALNGPQFLTDHVLKNPIRVDNGKAYLPEGPGLGVEVDENKVHKLVRESGGDDLLDNSK